MEPVVEVRSTTLVQVGVLLVGMLCVATPCTPVTQSGRQTQARTYNSQGYAVAFLASQCADSDLRHKAQGSKRGRRLM